MENEKKTNEAGQSMLSYVGKATTGYTKKKGQIVCNKGEQADQVIKLLKKSYKSVTQEDGKGGKVIIKFSKNESLGEAVSEAYKLRVRFKDKKTNQIHTRDYPYNGETDKKSVNWLKDADKIAFDNCAPNEDVLGYNLVKVGEDESLSEDKGRYIKSYYLYTYDGKKENTELFHAFSDGEAIQKGKEVFTKTGNQVMVTRDYSDLPIYMTDGFGNEYEIPQNKESLSEDEECSPRDIVGKYPVVASDGSQSVFVNAFDKLPDAVKYCEDNEWTYDKADGKRWILDIKGRIDSASGSETFLKRNPCEDNRREIGEAVEKIPYYYIALEDGPGGIDSTGRLIDYTGDFLEIDDPWEARALADYYSRKYGKKCVVKQGTYHVDGDKLIGKTDADYVDEAIDYDPYGQDNGFFTRDDLNEFTDACLADLGDGYDVSYSYITDGLLEVAFEKDDYEMRADERIDMRKIKKPSDLLKYKDSVVQKVRADYEENIKADQ